MITSNMEKLSAKTQEMPAQFEALKLQVKPFGVAAIGSGGVASLRASNAGRRMSAGPAAISKVASCSADIRSW